MKKRYCGKTYIYVGKTNLSKDKLLELFEFYEIPDENGITYDDNNIESWFTKSLNLKPFDEDYYYIEYAQNTTLKKVLDKVSISFEYDIPQSILNNNENIDFAFCVNEKSDIEITKNNYQYQDENISFQYIGEFDGYVAQSLV